METISDTIVNGRRKLVVKYTEAERAEMAKKMEEWRKKHQGNNQTREAVEKPDDKPKVEKAKKKSTKRAKGKKK